MPHQAGFRKLRLASAPLREYYPIALALCQPVLTVELQVR